MQGGMNPIVIVFYEHLLLTGIFSIIFFKSLTKIWKAQASHFFYFFVVGGVGSALATVAFTQAFRYLNPSLVILLQKFQPLIAIILARYVLGEKIQRAFIFWASICLLGAVLISYEDILNMTGTTQKLSQLLFHKGAVQGYLLVLISVIGWGAATVFGKKLSESGYSNEEIMAGRFIMGLACLIPFMVGESSLFTHNLETYGKISLMVVVSGVLAMWLFYQGLRKISARACSLAEMFFPFMAIIVNWIFLGTSLSPLQLIGGGVLLLGSSIIQLRRL
jgi:drug/metabolite transporter (DMT)-like permease